MFQGLVIKSKAPACMPSTASGMLPHAVISITGVSGWKIRHFFNSSMPSSPVVAREKFMSMSMSCNGVPLTMSSASSGDPTAIASCPLRLSITPSDSRIDLSSSTISIIK